MRSGPRWWTLLGLGAALATAAVAFGQGAGGELIGGVDVPEPAEPMGLFQLFRQSLDVFTMVLLAGSFFAGAVAVLCMTDIRTSKIAPKKTTKELRSLVESGRLGELKEFAKRETGLVAQVAAATMKVSDRGRDAMLDAAETESGLALARYLRKVDLLALIGNLAPLVGLAGTVWGMVLAFSALGAEQGQAGPAELSIGISKALFHTLLGLVLAIPCLLIAGVYRSAVERIGGIAVADALKLVDRVADRVEAEPNA